MSEVKTGPRVVAVGSGKGGTGKSLAAANVGVLLATLGKRVALVDAAFGAANLHSFVGVPEPRRSLADFLSREGAALEEVVVGTAVSNLVLVAGHGDPAWAADPRSHQLEHLRAQIRELAADYVVVDLGPGTGAGLLDLWLDADSGLVVIDAEPTAIELAYRFMKVAFVRALQRAELGHLSKMSVDEARDFEGGIASPGDLFARAQARTSDGDAELEAMRAQMERLRPLLVLNRARSKADMDLGAAVAAAATRRFGLAVPYLGHIEYDDAVWVSLRRRRPLLIEHPESRASRCIEKLTRRLIGREGEREVPVPGESHYELLEIEPTASDEDIRRANRRVRQTYARDSVVIAGLYSRDRLERLERRLDDAYDTLMDPIRRKAYDQALFPEGVPTLEPPRVEVSAPVPVAERPPMPEIDADAVFTGDLLREVREALGLELREIAERTKIGMTYLEAIENESFPTLPAEVYVRGFLVEFAKMLKLDVDRVLASYLPRYRAAREGQAEA